MARRMASKAAVETIRHRLDRSMTQFSEDLGFAPSAYADMVRTDQVTVTAALAAEALSRRQAPGAADEVVFLTRIVRGLPVITVLDGDTGTLTLGGRRYLLVPAAECERRPAPAHRENGAGTLATAPSDQL